MAAARTDVDARADQCAVGIDSLLGEKTTSPTRRCSTSRKGIIWWKATRARMHEGLDRDPKLTLHDYPGDDHGLATGFGQRRSSRSAEPAERRTSGLLPEIVFVKLLK